MNPWILTGPLWREPTVIGELSSRKASRAQSVAMLWRHNWDAFIVSSDGLLPRWRLWSLHQGYWMSSRDRKTWWCSSRYQHTCCKSLVHPFLHWAGYSRSTMHRLAACNDALRFDLKEGLSQIGKTDPDSKVHAAYMGPTWGRQDPGGPRVGPMNLATRGCHYGRRSCHQWSWHHNSFVSIQGSNVWWWRQRYLAFFAFSLEKVFMKLSDGRWNDI